MKNYSKDSIAYAGHLKLNFSVVVENFPNFTKNILNCNFVISHLKGNLFRMLHIFENCTITPVKINALSSN